MVKNIHIQDFLNDKNNNSVLHFPPVFEIQKRYKTIHFAVHIICKWSCKIENQVPAWPSLVPSLLKTLQMKDVIEIRFTNLFAWTSHPIFLQEALVAVDMVETKLKENAKVKPLLPVQLIRHREFQLPSGKAV